LFKKIVHIFLFLVVAKVFAQHPVSIHLTEKDGLPDIEFYDVLEDNKGFIWLAADKGLYRYDGKHFKNYSHPKKRGLSVFGLQLDPDGKVWCNNISGQYFYIENDELVLFMDLKTYTKGQLAMFSFYNGKLILLSSPQLLEIEIETKKTSLKTDKSNWYGAYVKYNDTIICTTNNNIKYFNTDFSKAKNYGETEYDFTDKRTVFFKYKNDVFLTVFNNNTGNHSFFIRKGKEFYKIQAPKRLENNRVITSFENNNLLWLCTDDGLLVYDYYKGKFEYKTSYFKSSLITKVIKDRNDNFWFTSLRNGVFIMPNIHLQQFNLPERVSNISCVDKINEHTLALGSTNGYLSIFDTKTQEIDTIQLKSKRKVSSICNNIYNDLVYISQDDASLTYNKKTKKQKHQKQFINAKNLSLIDETRVLYPTYAHAYVLDFKKEGAPNFINIGARRSYTSYYSEKTGKSYIGYVDDFEMYDEAFNSSVIRFNNEPIFVIDIDETNDGTIWVSTFKDGIIGIKNGVVFINYTTKNGLLSNQTSTIKSDGDKLWIVTDEGIQLLDTQTKTFKALTKKDGINSFNISEICVFENEVVFSSNKGLFKIEKEKAFKTKKLPEIHFTKVAIEDEVNIIKSNYSLAPGENKIQFYFHANGYQSEKKITYKYRLLGAENDWFEVNAGTNEITFNSLSAGKYTFQLKAVEKNGLKETPIKSVQIKINLPFYKEWWFMMCFAILTGLLIVLYYRNKLRIKENEKQQQLEKVAKESELVFLKLENLRSQMNPHFIFNALNSIQDYILLNQKNLAGEYLGKFADLIRMYLNHSTKGSVLLSEEIEALSQYLELEKLRFEDRLHYQINVTNEIDNIEIPTMLIQPYVENAIKHGLLHKRGDRKLKISFSLEKEEQNLLCEVTDNGIGRAKASVLKTKRTRVHESFACKATNDRLELLNYGKEYKTSVVINDLYSKENTPIGTQVLISIPYIKR